MNKEKGSLMSEATLWQLYRRLFAEHLLTTRLAPPMTDQQPAHKPGRRHETGPTGRSAAVAAALAENVKPGDTLGLASGDLATRLACGVPVKAIRVAAEQPTTRRKKSASKHTWALPADPDHGILPAAGADQAKLAAGTALASRLHTTLTGGVTFLVATLPSAETSAETMTDAAPMSDWAGAAQMAVDLQLPLIFITESRDGSPYASAPADPGLPAPLLPAIPVDRGDAVALYRVIYESVARARTSGGPTWIDCRDVPQPRHRASVAAPDGAIAKLEATLRARQFFQREQQRHIERSLLKEFSLAGWSMDHS
jgi:TPP-dependent pyruvate/acetoin dehydrogenase alpha subunit